MRGCHLEWFHGSLAFIDMSPMSQYVVGLRAFGFPDVESERNAYRHLEGMG
jgi:hypothetical protein